MTSRLRLAATLSTLVLLAGCTDSPVVTRSTEPPGSASAASPVGRAPDSSGLGAAKRAAGIADCPTSDPDVPAVADGLAAAGSSAGALPSSPLQPASRPRIATTTVTRRATRTTP